MCVYEQIVNALTNIKKINKYVCIIHSYNAFDKINCKKYVYYIINSIFIDFYYSYNYFCTLLTIAI